MHDGGFYFEIIVLLLKIEHLLDALRKIAVEPSNSRWAAQVFAERCKISIALDGNLR